jgi:hypothetical protein
MQFLASGGTATTDKDTSARGLFEFVAQEHNGSGTSAVVTADGNIFAIRAQVSGGTLARFVVDEDGDIFVVSVTTDGNSVAATAFDEYDDTDLIRTFEKSRQATGIIDSEWDAFVRNREQDLVDIGVLGAPIDEGGMWNLTQHTRLLNGAVWQNRSLTEGLVAAILEAVPDARPAIEKYLGGRSYALQGAK